MEMKTLVRSLRIGYETNSSSTHSLVWLPEPRRTELEGPPRMGSYGWEWRVLREPEDVVGYILAQALCRDVRERERYDFPMLLELLAEDGVCRDVLIRPEKEEYGFSALRIDHASEWIIRGYAVVPQFFRDLAEWALKNERVGVATGNDNDDPEALSEEERRAYELLHEHAIAPFKWLGRDRPTFISKPGNYYLMLFTGVWDEELGVCREVVRARVAFHDKPLRPEWPESIDVKITEQCPFDCWFCFERRSRDGPHCRLKDYEDLVGNIAGHTLEIALGGGDPLCHPHCEEMVDMAKRYGVIPNFTTKDISWYRYLREHNSPEELERFRYLGIGLSLTSPWNLEKVLKLTAGLGADFLYYVLHVINRVHRTEDVLEAIEVWKETYPSYPKVLVLGFKPPFCPVEDVEERLVEPLDIEKLREAGAVLMFDDLAIRQLGVEDYVPPETWRMFYQGRDGEYTMFIDLVRMECARSSMPGEERYPIKKAYEAIDHFRSWRERGGA